MANQGMGMRWMGLAAVLLFASACLPPESAPANSTDATEDDLVNQPANSRCTFDAQCASGLICTPTSKGLYGPLDERCRPPGAIGAFCSEDGDCAAGSACQGASSGLAGLCVSGTAERCDWDIECSTGAVCRPTSKGLTSTLDNRCLSPAPVGTYCSEDTDCASGLICDGAGSSYAGTCIVGSAKACGWDFECSEGLVCRPSAPAASLEFSTRCLLPGNYGASCSEDQDCAAGLICNGASSSYAGKCQ